MVGGVVLGAVVVPVLVGAVVVLGPVVAPVVVVVVAGAAAPAAPVLVEGVVGAVSVVVPPVSEPQPSNASAITVQTLTLRRGARRDMKPFAWALSVEFIKPKFMSSLQGPAMPK